MKKYLLDKINSMSRQSVSTAVIVDSKGDMAGKILVRFTDSQIGWNHEISATLWGFMDENGNNLLSMNKSKKGNCYSNPFTLFKLFNDAGLKCYDYSENPISARRADSLSAFSSIAMIKHGNRKFRIYWAI